MKREPPAPLSVWSEPRVVCRAVELLVGAWALVLAPGGARVHGDDRESARVRAKDLDMRARAAAARTAPPAEKRSVAASRVGEAPKK